MEATFEMSENLPAVSRKRPLAKDENMQALDAKISKEAAKVIKMKVQSNVTNWELNEKVKELELTKDNQHHQLRQQQMQYQTLDEEYKNELRFRKDTLNKVNSTRNISKKLEDYCSAMHSSLSKNRNDLQTAYDAYNNVVKVTEDMISRHRNVEQQHQLTINNLEQLVNFERAAKDDINQKWMYATKQFEEFSEQLKSQLAQSLDMNNFLKKQGDVTEARLKQNDIEHKELKTDFSELKNSYKKMIEDTEKTMQDKNKQLLLAIEELKRIKEAMATQDTFLHDIINEKNQTSDKLCAIEEESTNQKEIIMQLKEKYAVLEKELNNTISDKNIINANCIKINEKYQKEREHFEEAQRTITMINQEKNELMAKATIMETDNQQKLNLLFKEKEEFNIVIKSNENKLLAEKLNVEALEAKNKSLQKELEEYMSENKTKILELERKLKEACSDVINKTDEITSLEIKVKSYNTQEIGLQKSFEDLKNTADIYKSENKMLEQNLEKMKNEILQLKSSSKKTGEENEYMKKQINTHEKDRSKILANLQNVKEELKKLENKSLTEKRNASLTAYNKVIPEAEGNNIYNGPVARMADTEPWRVPSKPIIKAPSQMKNHHSNNDNGFSDSSFDGFIMDPVQIDRQFNELMGGRKPNSPIRLIRHSKETQQQLSANQTPHSTEASMEAKPSSTTSSRYKKRDTKPRDPKPIGAQQPN